MIDYFKGYNEGMDRLTDALKNRSQRESAELHNAILRQQLESGELELEQKKTRRETLADIKKIQELGEKEGGPLARPSKSYDYLGSGGSSLDRLKKSLFPMDKFAADESLSLEPQNMDKLPVLKPPDLYQSEQNASQPEQMPPNPQYSQREKTSLMIKAALKRGDWNTLEHIGKVQEITDKIDAKEMQQVSLLGQQVSQFWMRTRDRDATEQFATQLAEKMGINPIFVKGIDFTSNGSILAPDGQGGNIAVMTDNQGKQHFIHVTAKEAPHEVQELVSPDGKTAQKFQYNPQTKRYDIPLGPAYRVKSQVPSVNVKVNAPAPDQIETLAQGIVDGTIDPNAISKRGNLQGSVWARVKEKTPDYNFVEAAAKAKYAQSNAAMNTTTLLSSVDDLFGELRKAGKALNNSSIPAWNKTVNKVGEYIGNPELVAFNNLRDDVIAELERGLLGTGVLSDSKYNRAIKNMNSAQNPKELEKAIENTKLVINARLRSISAGPYPGSVNEKYKKPKKIGRFEVEIVD